MTYREVYEKEKDWKKRVALIDFIRVLKRWSARETARYLDISHTLASKSVILAHCPNLNQYPSFRSAWNDHRENCKHQ